ncbi:MAG: PD-(D/E)XK nuclease family protein [Flavobacteriales bacterium]
MVNELHLLKLPPLIERPNGLLQATNCEYREVVICSLIGWLLNPINAPRVAPLLISELIGLVNKEVEGKITTRLTIDDFSNCEVSIEGVTDEGKRVDIVIHDTSTKSAIFIEAKIFHNVENPFDSYWGYLPYNDEQKLGVLLTLGKVSSPDKRFHNVTYVDWFAKVNAKLEGDLAVRERIYWEDLYQNMNYISSTMTMNDSIKYVFDHGTQVEELLLRRNQARDFIINQLDHTASILEWDLHGKSDYWRNIWAAKNESDIYFTVFPIEILKDCKRVELILEVCGPLVEHASKMRDFFTNHDNQFESVVHGDANYQHLGKWQIEIRDPEFLGHRLAVSIQAKLPHISECRKEMAQGSNA